MQEQEQPIENALKTNFCKNFLNRIDDIIIFNSLETEDIKENY